MRDLWRHLALATLAFVAAMLVTALTDLGLSTWHYTAALAVVVLVGAVARSWFRRRRVISMALAYFGAWSALTGFALLYHVGLLGGEDWMMWWHAVVSFAFTVAFLAHGARNAPRFGHLTRALFRRPAWGWPVGSAWALLLVAAALMAAPGTRALFELDGHRARATWALLVPGAVGAAAWVGLHPWRRADRLGRRRARGTVDGTLLLAFLGVALTGIGLVYAKAFLLDHDAYMLMRWWHTAASGLLLAGVLHHVTFNVRALRSHATRLDAELREARS